MRKGIKIWVHVLCVSESDIDLMFQCKEKLHLYTN